MHLLISTETRFLEARLGKPSLVRDTSRLTLLDTVKHPVKTFKRLRSRAEDSLQGVFLEVSFLGGPLALTTQ